MRKGRPAVLRLMTVSFAAAPEYNQLKPRTAVPVCAEIQRPFRQSAHVHKHLLLFGDKSPPRRRA